MAKKTIISNETEFSKRISDYIDKSGFTVYKISQITGLDRTAIQHAMSGKFVPQKEFFEKLCSVFIITPQQKDELTELYFKAKVGNKLYNERKQIKNIIENLPQYYINADSSIASNSKIGLSEEKSVTGLLNVNRTLINVIGRELQKVNPKIATTIPFDNKLLYDVVIQMFSHCKNEAVFEHYLRIFRNENETSDGNLDILENVLKMSMNAGIIYKPYNYYAYKAAIDNYMPIFPYCLITSEYLIMVSESFQTASILSDEGTLEIARKHIENIKQISKPMVELVDNKNMFDIFSRSTRSFDKSLEFQPCVSKYFTLDIIKKRIKDIPEKEYILNVLESSFFTAEEIEITKDQNCLNVFVKKGLKNFVDTGIMVNLPGQLLDALSIDERIYILECMKNEIGQHYIMLDEAKMNVPDFMQIIYLNNQSCLISCLMEDKKFCCVINERSLSLSIEDFIRSLWEMGMTVDNGEIVEVIDKCIQKLKQMSHE